MTTTVPARSPWLLPTVLGLALPALPLSGQDLAAALDAFVGDPALAGARVGVHVVDVATGDVLAAHDHDRGFMTASNMKLVSSVTALAVLGPDHVFETRVATAGDLVEGGVLKGDVYLIGSGDPTLGGRQEPSPLAVMERLAAAVRQTGVRTIEGRIIGVDDVHADEVMGKGWQWDYQSSGYAAQISGLCFAENVARITIAPGEKAGDWARVKVDPDVGFLAVGPVRTAAAGAKADLQVERRRASNIVDVRGAIPVGAEAEEFTVSVENPTSYAALALFRALAAEGIGVRGLGLDQDSVRDPVPEKLRTLATHRSAPLRDIVRTVLKVSQNLYAEQLLRAAGAEREGVGSLKTGVEAARSVFEGFDVDVAGLGIEDGSGLTRRNLVQPRHLTGLLRGAWKAPFRDVLWESLPVAGVDGTLSGRFPEGDPAHGEVRAKTGYISRVVALSGYVPRAAPGGVEAGGDPVAFSILVNNFTCPTDDAKAAVDRFVNTLVEAVAER